MIIESMILALGIAIPVDCPKEQLWRRQGVVICKQSNRVNKAFTPRRVERPQFKREINRAYTKVRKPIPTVRTLLGIKRYERRSKRSIVRGVEHILQSRDRAADLARRRAIQKAYSDKRLR